MPHFEIMNAFAVSESLSSWGWPMAAAIGGVIVFAGLLMEKIAERKTERHIPSFVESHKWLENLGWKFLMFGILVEIGVGFAVAWKDERHEAKTANEIAQASTNLENADTRNVPIVSIIGRVRVDLKPPFKDFAKNLNLPKIYEDAKSYNPNVLPVELPFLLSDDKELQKHEMVFFQFGRNPNEDVDSEIPIMGQVSAMVDLVGDSITNVDNIGLEINLFPPADNSPVFNPKKITFNDLKYVHFWIGNGWPPPKGVVGGQIELLINGFWPKTFLIEPQTNNEFPYRVMTTNVLQTSQN